LPGIHPTVKFGKNAVLGINVIIGENVIIGDDCFIGHNCHIRNHSIVGDRTTIRTGCLVDPNCKIGNDVKIMPHAIVGGGCIIEDKVYYGPQCMTANTNRIGVHRGQDADYVPIVIKKGAVLYTGCLIKGGVTIGRNSIIGMGSVVTKNVPNNEVWMGNPAKKVRKVKDEEQIIVEEEKSEVKQPWPYSAGDILNDQS
jgi:acetyltransferase-like isoleucine patch superfamily enzyme